MQHGLCAYMRLCVLLVALLEATLAITVANKVSAKSSGDETEVNLEWEVFGPASDRHYGINILDENGEVIISDPTERVLRAVAHPDDSPASLALHKRLLSEGRVQAHDSLRHSVAEDEKTEQDDQSDGSVFDSLVNWLWGEA